MKTIHGLAITALAWLAITGAAQAEVRDCTDSDADTAQYQPREQIESLRQFTVAPISYTGGDNAVADFPVRVLVGVTGEITCAWFPRSEDYELSTTSTDPDDMLMARIFSLYVPDAELRAAVNTWRYTPYLVDDKPQPFFDTVSIVAAQAEAAHEDMPPAAPGAMTLTYHHVAGYCGFCPSYDLVIHDDGRVEYEGRGADIIGKLSYTIAQETAAALFETVRWRGLWSLRDKYDSAVYDAANDVLILDIGDRRKYIRDYMGKAVGMPEAVTATEDDVRMIAGVDRWLNITPDSLSDLEAQGFDFTGRDGAELLIRVILNSHDSDATIMALLDRGVLLTGYDLSAHDEYDRRPDALLPASAAILADRPAILDRLLDQGALPDQHAVDDAFEAAIAAERLDYMQRISPFQPSMTFAQEEDVNTDPINPATPSQSVLFLISPFSEEAVPMVKLLADMGADINSRDANGGTVLHRLGESVEMVQYLLEQGVEIDAVDNNGATAIMSLSNEDAVLYLLEAGADPQHVDNDGGTFYDWIAITGWERVAEWLAAHGYSAPVATPTP